MASFIMNERLKPNGEFVTINQHKIHIYRQGNISSPKLVFMSGSGTVAPVYDFKILYKKLISKYRVIVIEKFGYGYSDIFESSCDIDSLVSFQREALEKVGEKGPFILLPHSMSGLEAIRWKQKYPDDVTAIIGIDMATPKTYKEWSCDEINKRINAMRNLQKIKNCGLLSWYPLNRRGLSKDEIKQQRILWKRNGMNNCFINEAKEVMNNAIIVEESGGIECPTLLFVSNGKQVSPNWIDNQQEFAKQMKAEFVCLDCGHYIHYFKSDEMYQSIIKFTDTLFKNI